MREIVSEIRDSFREGSVLTKLIYINLFVFLGLKLIQVIYFLGGNREFMLYDWLMLPSNFSLLMIRPWTLFTYMFLHESFIHILSNLLVLYWFGKLFLELFSDDKLMGLYILGGLAGAATYLAAYHLFPVFEGTRESSFLLGASASVISILMASAFYDPEREIFIFLIGKVQLKYVAVFLILLYIIGITATNPGGNLAHLGGAVMGFIFAIRMKKGKSTGTWIYKFLSGFGNLFRRKEKVKVSFKQPPRDDVEYNRQRNASQQEINRILDKISRSGYDSLTKAEKDLLFRQGKN